MAIVKINNNKHIVKSIDFAIFILNKKVFCGICGKEIDKHFSVKHFIDHKKNKSKTRAVFYSKEYKYDLIWAFNGEECVFIRSMKDRVTEKSLYINIEAALASYPNNEVFDHNVIEKIDKLCSSKEIW